MATMSYAVFGEKRESKGVAVFQEGLASYKYEENDNDFVIGYRLVRVPYHTVDTPVNVVL